VGGRPVLNLSLAVNYAISGTAVWSYHALNLLIHILSGLALFGIVRRTPSPRLAGAPTLAALSVALLWVLHPLDTESVTYIAQRAESLMGLFYLVTLYSFIRGSGDGGWRGCAWQFVAVAACALGMATKEVMVTAPVIVLLYDRAFLSGSFRDALRLRSWAYAGLAASWLVLVLLVLPAHGRANTAGFGSAVPWHGYALTQLAAVSRYLGLCFWPSPLVFDYGTDVVALSQGLLPCGLLVSSLLALTAWALVRRPALGFLGACFFLILAPSSSIVPVATQTMAEHRMYLPLIPLVVLAVVGIRGAFGRAAWAAVSAIALALLGATWQRNETYRSAESLWSDTVRKRPGNERAHLNLALELQKSPGHQHEAIAQLEEAVRLNPGYAEAHNDLGCVLEAIPGRANEAVNQCEQALRLDPEYADAHYNLGNALCDQGRTQEATAHYREALRIRPDFPEAHCNLASALGSLGRRADAIAQYEEALRLLPDDPTIHYDLALELLRDPGRKGEAMWHLAKVVRLQPDNASARRLLEQAKAQ
jgi:Flp pilus assembly protein TadD